MGSKALQIFKYLLRKGYISREEDQDFFSDYRDIEVREDLSVLEAELDFILYETGGRVYFISGRDNDIFTQNSQEIKESIGSDTLNIDLFLNYYIIIFLLYLFYRGENNDPKVRGYLLIQDLILELDARMKRIIDNRESYEEKESETGINFTKVAENWTAKQYGEAASLKKIDKTGCVNRGLIKLRNEGLIQLVEDDTQIKTTRKLDDLMPYYLRESRVEEINQIFAKGGE